MTFDDEPKDACDQLPAKYQPRFFTTTALQQAKVELTWDETNPDRLEISEKISSGKLDDISEKELENYLAASSDEDHSSEESEAEDSAQGKRHFLILAQFIAVLQAARLTNTRRCWRVSKTRSRTRTRTLKWRSPGARA